MALTLDHGGKGGGKGGRYQPYQGGKGGGINRLCNVMEKRMWQDEQAAFLADKEKAEREKREEKQKEADERKKWQEELAKQQADQNVKNAALVKDAMEAIYKKQEDAEKRRIAEREEREAKEKAKKEESDRKAYEQDLERERKRLEKERDALEKDRQKMASAQQQSSRTPAPMKRIPKADTPQENSSEEDDDDNKDTDEPKEPKTKSWRDAFAKEKESKKREQRVKAPIEVSEWTDWEAGISDVRKVIKKLGLKKFEMAKLKDSDILEFGSELAKSYKIDPLKKLHKKIVGSEPKARWSKDDVMVSIIASIVSP